MNLDKKHLWYIGAGIAVVVLLIAIGAYFFTGDPTISAGTVGAAAAAAAAVAAQRRGESKEAANKAASDAESAKVETEAAAAQAQASMDEVTDEVAKLSDDAKVAEGNALFGEDA